MKSQATPKFWKLYARLPHHVQQRARNAYQLWKRNPSHWIGTHDEYELLLK